jgi:Flp pilus assembly pilin Flp
MPGERSEIERRDGWHGLDAERGQTMAEYAVVLAVLFLGAVTAFSLLGTALDGALSAVGDLIGSV